MSGANDSVLQLQWLEEKHHRNLAELANASDVNERVVICADAASEFQRATVEWGRTFELIHEWIARTRDVMGESPSLENLEAYASSAKGLVDKSVFYDVHVAKPKERSKRAMQTLDVALELCELAEQYPGSWQIVRAGADVMAQLILGSMQCKYRLDFDPFERLQRIAWVQLDSGSADPHVMRVYLDVIAEHLGRALRQKKPDALQQWELLRQLVQRVGDLDVVGGAYCKAVAALVKAGEFPDAEWLDREVQLVSSWWFGADSWVRGRAELYPQFGRVLERAINAAPNQRARKRYERLYEQYVESLPNWE